MKNIMFHCSMVCSKRLLIFLSWFFPIWDRKHIHNLRKTHGTITCWKTALDIVLFLANLNDCDYVLLLRSEYTPSHTDSTLTQKSLRALSIYHYITFHIHYPTLNYPSIHNVYAASLLRTLYMWNAILFLYNPFRTL